jgi:crotonobetainyl-CoA:carnitine CoA-transferase CaiB-like acyl-CoA transferase
MPLDGVKVLDFSQQLPGPLSTRILCQFGAEVWKVEPPAGDPMRERLGGVFDCLNRGKRAIVVDLKQEDGRDLIHTAVPKFDVVVESFRPGVAARLAIDYDTLSANHRGLIYCSISGYGQSGPYRNFPGHDVNYAGLGSAIWFSGDPAGWPDWTAGIPVVDIMAGQFAVVSIMAALLQRDAEGHGQFIDLSMTDVIFSASELRLQEYFFKGSPPRSDLMARSSYGVFTCADGGMVALGAIEDKFWYELCRILGLDDLAADPRLTRYEERNRQSGTIRARIAGALLRKSRAEWFALVEPTALPLSAVSSPEEALADPQLRHRGLITGDEQAFEVGLPAAFSRFSPHIGTTSPDLGEHMDGFRSQFTADSSA